MEMGFANNSDFIDFYALLGIEPSAEITDIRRAYLKKAKEHHPDTGGSTETMQQLNTAYKTLASSTSKAAYDMLHSFHSGKTSPSDYRYSDGREVNGVHDMTDDEIDSFLDGVFAEYRNGPPKARESKTGWFKKLFN